MSDAGGCGLRPGKPDVQMPSGEYYATAGNKDAK